MSKLVYLSTVNKIDLSTLCLFYRSILQSERRMDKQGPIAIFRRGQGKFNYIIYEILFASNGRYRPP